MIFLIIRESAWKTESLKKYDRTMERIQELKEKNQVVKKF